MNFILCADLHLKESEKDYSFSVLREIIRRCREKNCDALLFAGDIFDSRQDLVTLRMDFRSALEELHEECSVFFLPGNHEELRAANNEKLDSFDFGRAKLLSKKPFSLLDFGPNAEILAVPYQNTYSDYKDWELPAKTGKIRILLAHTTISGIIYTGQDEESTSILDDEMLNFFEIDIAAIGHIHKAIYEQRKNCRIVYPGSSRVWREGEDGKRAVLYCDLEGASPEIKTIYIEAAGEYRKLSCYANTEGELKINLNENFSKEDWIMLELNGVVEEEGDVLENLEKIKKELEKKYRKVTYKTDKLSVLSGVSTHPLAKSFISQWEAQSEKYSKEEKDLYELVRLRGLLALKNILEKRK